jgi:hypothetical protein
MPIVDASLKRIKTIHDVIDNRNNENPEPNRMTQQLPFPFRVCVIPTLSDASKKAKELLHRVVQEFLPIITRRQYNILSISEMCCCNDGLDFDENDDDKDKRRKRKRKLMGSNVWGYNQITTTRSRFKSHTIHIRLRKPNNHQQFLSYEDVAGTLAHELAHCERAPHDAPFYKVMDSILEEHAQQQISNVNVPFMQQQQQQQQQQQTVGHKLGGDTTFICWMTPKEAAVAAAECRRRQHLLRHRGDFGCCQTIQIDDDEDDNENSNHHHPKRIHPPTKQPRTLEKIPEVVDLTDINTKDDYVTEPRNDWSCPWCTYRNRAMALACDICQMERTIG